MIRRPPRSTRTYTLSPYTTLFRSIEHVTDPPAFLDGLAGALAPGGLMVRSTPNRTAMSRLAMITLGEGFGQMPKGTHDWHKFLTPEELQEMLARAGLEIVDQRGLSFNPDHGFVLSDRDGKSVV